MAVSRTCVQSILFLAFTLCFDLIKTEEEVIISQGKIRGTTLTSRNGRKFTGFLGIPYAQPPIGSLRFKNPLPADSWNATFVADTDGNQCPQYNDDGLPVGYEDCLYLNVYTPKTTPTVLYPTMVYIHGGAFIRGNGSTKYVAPDYIIDRDVVLVAMNYRLGVLGFLSTGDAEATGNFGLKDQVLALRWVKENIKEFGGDPNRVTLFGQSAGSVSVNLHVLSDASDDLPDGQFHFYEIEIVRLVGLFNRYIAHSGSSLCFWAYREISDYKEHATNLGKHVNCPTDNSKVLINCLRETDIYTLLDSNDIFNEFTRLFQTWVPTNEPELEGAFLTTSPINRILKNKMKDCPCITGNVADEGLIVTAQLYSNDTLYEMVSTDFEQFLRYITANFIEDGNVEKLSLSVKNFYFNDVDPSDRDAFTRSLTNLMSDTAFLFPVIVQMYIFMQQMKNTLYFYSFEYRGSYSETTRIVRDKNIGVTHNDDLIYIFPISPQYLGLTELKFSQSDENMIDIMIDLWTSFAYEGVPTSNHTTDQIIWHPYSKDMTYLRIGQNSDPSLALKNNFCEKRMHFWAMQLLKITFRIL